MTHLNLKWTIADMDRIKAMAWDGNPLSAIAVTYNQYSVWEMTEHERRVQFHSRTTAAARNTRLDAEALESCEKAEARRLAEEAEAARLQAIIDGPHEPKSSKSDEIINEICSRRGVHRRDIMSRARAKSISKTRGEICYWLRVKVGRSYTLIGIMMGLHHTTVMQAVREYAKRNGLAYE